MHMTLEIATHVYSLQGNNKCILWNLLLLLFFNLNCLHAMALGCYVTLWQSPALDARVVLVHVHMQAQTDKQTHAHTQTHPARERLTNTFK